MVVLAGTFAGCTVEGAETGDEADVVVRTETPEEWAQYVADATFAKSYTARCKPHGTRPRVLVTGFGRFMSNATNASGHVVSSLVPGLVYPETQAPPAGQVDDPAAQTSVALGTITLPHTGEVDVCGMVLPVAWDLSAVLALKEIQSFRPNLVIMNGIAGDVQPIWIELGSVNHAMSAPDGSGTLQPAVDGAPLVKTAPASEEEKGLHLSWWSVRAAADQAIAAHAKDKDGAATFSSKLTGTAFAGFPRESNTYLCNNVTYVVNFLMDHPNRSLKLLTPSVKKSGGPTGVTVKLTRDYRETPRVFVHWPSSLAGAHWKSGAAVLGAMIDAQLDAIATGEDPPTDGDNSLADIPGEG